MTFGDFMVELASTAVQMIFYLGAIAIMLGNALEHAPLRPEHPYRLAFWLVMASATFASYLRVSADGSLLT